MSDEGRLLRALSDTSSSSSFRRPIQFTSDNRIQRDESISEPNPEFKWLVGLAACFSWFLCKYLSFFWCSEVRAVITKFNNESERTGRDVKQNCELVFGSAEVLKVDQMEQSSW